MATIKINEGTKFETPVDLEDGEGIIFVHPHKNRMWQSIDQGCLMSLLGLVTLGIIYIFKPKQRWQISFVLTNKRIVAIPVPPNKKQNPVSSYYYKNIINAKRSNQAKKSDEARIADLYITLSGKGNQVTYRVGMALTAGNIFSSFKADIIEGEARNASVRSATSATFDQGIYTQQSIDKYYAAMEKAAKDRAANMDFSKAGHAQILDYIVDVINSCVEEAKK
jgi:hypothetical protein